MIISHTKYGSIYTVLFTLWEKEFWGGGALNFFGGYVPQGFSKVGSTEQIFSCKKIGTWEQIFAKTSVFGAEILTKSE